MKAKYIDLRPHRESVIELTLEEVDELLWELFFIENKNPFTRELYSVLSDALGEASARGERRNE